MKIPIQGLTPENGEPEDVAQDAAEEDVPVPVEEEDSGQGCVEQLKAALAEAQDRYLRALADLDNLRKRARRDRSDALVAGKAEMLAAILPAVDNVERALASGGEDAEALLTGVRMVYDQFVSALASEGVTRIEAAGAAFNPNIHEAVVALPSEDVPTGHVVEEVEPGYALGDRVIRMAKVVVAAADDAT